MAMTLGTIGQYPITVLPLEYNRSVPSRFRVLLADHEPEWLFLVAAKYYASGESTVYFSDKGHITTQDDPVLPNQNFPGRLSERGFTVQSSLFADRFPDGGGSTRGSEISVVFGDEDDFYSWPERAWDGRQIQILAGARDFLYSEFGVIANWRILGLEMQEGQATFILRDLAEIFQKSVQQSLYAGTGDEEGGADLAGAVKPLLFGRRRNIAPVPLNLPLLIYQFHDGPVHAVHAVRDKGVALVLDQDYADYAALAAASISGGEYGTCLAEGFVRLGSAPDGAVTLDASGDKTGGVYVSDAASIVRRIVTTRLGDDNISDPSGLNGQSFSDTQSRFPAVTGKYLNAPTRIADVLTELMRDVFGYWYFERDGKLAVGLFERSATASVTLTEEQIGEPGLELLALSPPPYRVRVGYQPMDMVQRDLDLAGSVSDADRALFGEAYRFSLSESATIKTAHLLSDVLDWPTGLDDKDDSDALADRIAAFGDPNLRRFRVPLVNSLLKYWAGQAVRLQTEKFNLSSGMVGTIVDIAENYATGETVLEVIG